MKRSVSLLSTLALLLTAGNASAVVVNVDFGFHPDHPGGQTSLLYSGTAAAPDVGTLWNEVQVLDNNAFEGGPGEFGFWNANVTVPNLKTSLGVVTPISVTAVAGPSTGAFGTLQGSTNIQCVATDAVDLMRDYLIALDSSTQHILLNGFKAGQSVDLYLYGAGDTSNRDTKFTITDTLGPHVATTTGTISNDGNFPVAHTLTLGGDYVKLSGILADAAGAIDISYTHDIGSAEGPFNGLQAVFAPVPEPASIVMLALGGLMMIRFLKK